MGGRIKTIALLAGASFERGIGERELDEYLADAQNLLWVDVTDPGEDERAFLLEHFGFHPLAIEDGVRGRQRPKLDEHGAYFFAVSYGVLAAAPAAPDAPAAPPALAEVGLFVGKNYVVTVHERPVPALESAFVRFERSGALLKEGAGYLLYLVLDGLVSSYGPTVDALGEALAAIEDEITHGPAEQRIERLLALRRDVFHLRRFLVPMREALSPLLRQERALVTPAVRVYLRDVQDHVLRLLDLLDLHREMVVGSLDASLTIVSNRLNTTMKRLTVVSAVVGSAGAIFGAWGMNVAGVPGAEHAFGFAWVVSGTGLLILVTVVLGFRKGWL